MAKAQTEIPGTERLVDEEIESAAEDYRTYRDERMALQEKEAEAKRALIAVMESKGVKAYRYEDSTGTERKVLIEEKQNAKVTKVKPTNPDADTNSSGGNNVSVQ